MEQPKRTATSALTVSHGSRTVCKITIQSKFLAHALPGQLLAIAWNDGSVRLIGAESTKVVHHFNTGDGSPITCMGWASNLTRRVTSWSESNKAARSWDDFLTHKSEVNGLSGITEPLNLPQDLAQIDIETSLPKLSVLASGGSS